MSVEANGWLAKWLRWRRREVEASIRDSPRPEPHSARVKRGWRHTELKFAGNVTQSRMRTFRPWHLLVPYTRTMMASLLFRPEPALIGMVGLGGGSQVKFCHRHLPRTRLEAVENDPDVVALRRRFRIPDDDARLQVSIDDGERFLQARPGRYDILLVDAYDPAGIPAALSTQRWYDTCRDALAADGVMASNLYCDDPAPHIARIRRSFGERRVLVLKEPRMSNRVVFAWVGNPLPPGVRDAKALVARLPRALRRELAVEFARVADALRQHG